MKKRFNIWLDEIDLNKIKKRAKEERRSINGFILFKIFKDNKKAQGIFSPFYLFMIGIIIFIIGLSFVSTLTNTSNQVQGDMNCTNSSISYSQKITCVTVDVFPAWIIGFIISLGGVALAAKFLI